MTFFELVTYIFMAIFAITVAWFLAVSAWFVMVFTFLGAITNFGMALIWCSDTKDSIMKKWRDWK